MADWSYLRIGEIEVMGWRWDIPAEGEPILNLVFTTDDKIIENESEPGQMPFYTCTYKTTVGEVKKRFDDATIERLLAIGWWNWDDERIVSAIPLLLNNDIEKFIQEYDK